MKKYYLFKPSKEESMVDFVKWCRRSLGERGVEWDFHGGLAKVIIEVSQGSKAEATLLLFKDLETR